MMCNKCGKRMTRVGRETNNGHEKLGYVCACRNYCAVFDRKSVCWWPAMTLICGSSKVDQAISSALKRISVNTKGMVPVSRIP